MTKTLTARTSVISLAIASFLLLGMFANLALAAGDEGEAPIVGTAEISESEALSIAGDTYTGAGRFTDIELEMEMGVLVYAVEYTERDGNEVDVKLNAKTGAVVLVESDKDEVADDEGETDGDGDADEDQVAKMQTLVNLLNQLIALIS